MSLLTLTPAMPKKLEQAELEAATKRGFVAALRMLGNRADAEDACQEAAARAWAARDRYDPERPFYAWYHRILKNLCIDRLGSRKNKVASEDAAEKMSTADATQESGLLEREAFRRTHEAIARLDDPLREIIELRHFQDASYAEIADILDIPMGTVMSRLYRARRALRDELAKEETS
jgi:RNA polymerase sigma-70 factor (ECF subfamily)